jgi:hypothetical protein
MPVSALDQFLLPAPDARARRAARQAVRAEAQGKTRLELVQLIRDAYAAGGTATPAMTEEVALIEGTQRRLGWLRLLVQMVWGLPRARAGAWKPDPAWLDLRTTAVRLPRDAGDRWVTLGEFRDLDNWANLVSAEAPHRFLSVVYLFAWAQREHRFGERHDRWTIRIGQEVMGHVPLGAPQMLRSDQTGQPIVVSARLLPRSSHGPALLEVRLPAEAPVSETDKEDEDRGLL